MESNQTETATCAAAEPKIVQQRYKGENELKLGELGIMENWILK